MCGMHHALRFKKGLTLFLHTLSIFTFFMGIFINAVYV